jgi:nucleoside-diphosphate-sugar epimerase
MHVLILGAGGMIGAKLARRIAADSTLAGQPVTQLTLADIAAPTVPPFAGTADSIAIDIADTAAVPRLIAGQPDVIFLLAAIVSGVAEADFDRGYAVNLDGTRALFEAIRHTPGYRPRVVFTSSLAAFGPPFPEVIPDDFHAIPATSYGTQKVIGELLLNDYSRRGFLDGVGLRLPTICIRPGRPNGAASSFFSGILREPLAGLPADLPVPETTRHWFASPRAAVEFLLHAAALDAGTLGTQRALNMPGLSATVGDQIDALRRAAGEDAVRLIRRVEDPRVAAIVATWAGRLTAERATALGFRAETDFDQIIRVYLEDDAPPR